MVDSSAYRAPPNNLADYSSALLPPIIAPVDNCRGESGCKQNVVTVLLKQNRNRTEQKQNVVTVMFYDG